MNCLVIFYGIIITEERKVDINFEPFKPINTSLYVCKNKFHSRAMNVLSYDDGKFGFTVMDGNG